MSRSRSSLVVLTFVFFLGWCCLSPTETAMLREVKRAEEFNSVLAADRAALFFWVNWSLDARHSETVVRAWVRDSRLPFEVYRAVPDQQPFVSSWLAQQGREDMGYLGGGAVVWLHKGAVVAEAPLPRKLGKSGLQRLTSRVLRQP
jgi:hypothetical protein